LLVDEIDTSLHPWLTARLVSLFQDPEANPRNAQLICTTHDTTLLSPTLGDEALARDQVWFTEKNAAGETNLYPLSDFKPRKGENVERRYLGGSYGAVPKLFPEDLVATMRGSATPMARRESTQRRRPGDRQPRNRVLIVCCGEKTEKRYLDGLRRTFPDSPVVVRIKPAIGAPSGLVAYAEKLRDQNAGEFDEVWCVFDVDDYAADVEVAAVAARKADVSVAVSNPCFEFWLLLHLRDHKAWLNGPPDAEAKLVKCLPEYDKTKLNFAHFAPGVRIAISRGRDHAGSGRTYRDNPFTTMWRLADVIIGG
jgi:hypothetical protein